MLTSDHANQYLRNVHFEFESTNENEKITFTHWGCLRNCILTNIRQYQNLFRLDEQMCPNENITLQFKNLVKVQSCFVKLQKCPPNFDIMFREIVIDLLIQEISRKSGKISRNLKLKVSQPHNPCKRHYFLTWIIVNLLWLVGLLCNQPYTIHGEFSKFHKFGDNLGWRVKYI